MSDGKHEGQRLLGVRRCRLEDNVKMNLKETAGAGVCEDVDWIYDPRNKVFLASSYENCNEFHFP